MERKSFEEGIILALVSPPIPHVVKKPISYSYNGVILPALPEWDREMYPYAAIFAEADGLYSLICFSRDAEYTDFSQVTGNIWFGRIYEGSIENLKATCKSGDTEWTEFTMSIVGWVINGPKYDVSGEFMHEIIWSDFNVEYGGTTYMTASEPIPVYK